MGLKNKDSKKICTDSTYSLRICYTCIRKRPMRGLPGKRTDGKACREEKRAERMGFTIEDMLTVSRDKYSMKLVGGEAGWSNSISWILLIEDMTVLKNFKGKDLAVTTGLGFPTEEQQLSLVEQLIAFGAAGLIINTGMYIMQVPDAVKAYCDENDFPLLTVPWDTELFELIKELNMRILLQGMTDEQISGSFIRAIEAPEVSDSCRKELMPYFDVDGTFQVILITTGDLDTMDTVERRRISFQLQIYLESITHNASFFYYDGSFVVVINAVPQEYVREVMDGFLKRAERRLPQEKLTVGAGSILKDISSLHFGYLRAKAAVNMAFRLRKRLVWFDELGLYRMLCLIPDPLLKKEMGEQLLAPVLAYDRKHASSYMEMLETYLACGGSIQAVAEQMYTHRNTVIYRMNNIRALLGSDLESAEDRVRYQIACMLLRTEPSSK